MAAEKNSADVAELLIKSGANIHVIDVVCIYDIALRLLSINLIEML